MRLPSRSKPVISDNTDTQEEPKLPIGYLHSNFVDKTTA
ncbi:unnamed protein product, partial [marine sediment metagenome]